MLNTLSFSTWNIHGLTHNVLGDKTKIKDFTNNIMKTDFMFLTETWSNKDINIHGFKAFVSDPTTLHTDWPCRLSGGIALLFKIKFEKYISIVKKYKDSIWYKVSDELLNNSRDLFRCSAYMRPEKSVYFDNELFDELENDIINFGKKGNIMVLGDFNGRTSTL